MCVLVLVYLLKNNTRHKCPPASCTQQNSGQRSTACPVQSQEPVAGREKEIQRYLQRMERVLTQAERMHSSTHVQPARRRHSLSNSQVPQQLPADSCSRCAEHYPVSSSLPECSWEQDVSHLARSWLLLFSILVCSIAVHRCVKSAAFRLNAALPHEHIRDPQSLPSCEYVYKSP